MIEAFSGLPSSFVMLLTTWIHNMLDYDNILLFSFSVFCRARYLDSMLKSEEGFGFETFPLSPVRVSSESSVAAILDPNVRDN